MHKKLLKKLSSKNPFSNSVPNSAKKLTTKQNRLLHHYRFFKSTNIDLAPKKSSCEPDEPIQPTQIVNLNKKHLNLSIFYTCLKLIAVTGKMNFYIAL